MNCANHVEVPAVAYCRTCGKPMCSMCTRDVRGVILLRGVSGLASKRHHAAATGPGNMQFPVELLRPARAVPAWPHLWDSSPASAPCTTASMRKGFIHVLIFAGR